jgi:hypothetical protein
VFYPITLLGRIPAQQHHTSKEVTENLLARTAACTCSARDRYDWGVYPGQQRFRLGGQDVGNFYTAVATINEEIYSQQANYLSYAWN